MSSAVFLAFICTHGPGCSEAYAVYYLQDLQLQAALRTGERFYKSAAPAYLTEIVIPCAGILYERKINFKVETGSVELSLNKILYKKDF